MTVSNPRTPKKRCFQMSVRVGSSWSPWELVAGCTIRTSMATAHRSGRGAVERCRDGSELLTPDGVRRFRRDPAAPPARSCARVS